MENYTLITGATGGLGRAFVDLLGQTSNLILTGTSEAKLKALASEVSEKYNSIKVLYKACDMSIEEDRKNLIDFIKQNGNVNYLVNNAGYIAEGDFLKHDDEEILKIIRVNCEGTIDITQKIIKARNVNEALNIITVASLAAYYPMPHMAIYASTKAMLKNFMIALAIELKDQNVFITTVCPSGIPTTEAMKDAIKAQGKAGKMTMCSPEKVAMLAVKGANKHKLVVVPKAVNKFVKGISKLISEKSLANIVGKIWKKSQSKRNF